MGRCLGFQPRHLLKGGVKEWISKAKLEHEMESEVFIVPYASTYFHVPLPWSTEQGDWTSFAAGVRAKTVWIRWTPHSVIVTLKDNGDYIRVLLYSRDTTITGWKLLLNFGPKP